MIKEENFCMSKYYKKLKSIAQEARVEDFDEVDVQEKAVVYYLLINEDSAWLEDIIVGEGSDPKPFITSFCSFLLSANSNNHDLTALRTLFFLLCDSYMYSKVQSDYELIRQNTAH